MKEYIVGFTRYGVKLDGRTNEELLNSFVRINGGSQGTFDYIMNNLQFMEQHIKDAEIVKEDLKELTEDGSS